MKASAFLNNTNYDADARLVSPEIDLSGYTSASASFEQALNFFSSTDQAKKEALFEVSTDGGSTWTPVAIPNYPDSMSWTFVSTGSIDLSAYAGKKIKVAFHYIGTAAKSGTWELNKLNVYGTK